MSAHRKGVEVLAEELGFISLQDFDAHWDWVVDHCRQNKDVKLPMTEELLCQLVAAADSLFVTEVRQVMRVAPVLAFVGMMHMSEYTAPRQGHSNHCLRTELVIISKEGLGVEFYTDKTSSQAAGHKHQLFKWVDMPQFCEPILREYGSSEA